MTRGTLPGPARLRVKGAMTTLTNYTNHIADVPLDAVFEPFRWSKQETA